MFRKDRRRSIELKQILPLLTADADWVCVQKEIRERDAALLRQLDNLAFYGDDYKDFNDTAAIFDLMDLIITTDTNLPHLAGAMGKPVWILLSYNPDWRWLLDRDDSPWYPSARLFRQKQIGDWAGVIDEICNEFRSVIASGRPM